MFVACGIWCLADVSSVSPSSEQTGELWENQCLRAADCKNQKSAGKRGSMDFFIFCPEKPFGELLSKITIKLSKEFSFLRNLAKREMSCSGSTRH